MATKIVSEESIKRSLAGLAVVVAISFVFLTLTAISVARSLNAVEAASVDSASRTRANLTRQEILQQMSSGFRILQSVSVFLDAANVISPQEVPESDSASSEAVQSMQRMVNAIQRVGVSVDFLSVSWYAPSGEGVRLDIEGSARRIWLSDDSIIAQETVARAFGGERAVSSFHFDQASQRRIFILAMPVFIEGRIAGVLASTNGLGAIQRALENSAAANPQYSFFLVDETSSFLLAMPANDFPEVIRYQQGEEMVILPVFPPETRYQIQRTQNGFISTRQGNATYRGYIQSLGVEGAGLRVICINTQAESGAVTNTQIGVARLLFTVFSVVVAISLLFGIFLTTRYAYRLIRYLFFDGLTGADNINRFRRKLGNLLEKAVANADSSHGVTLPGQAKQKHGHKAGEAGDKESEEAGEGNYGAIVALNVRQFRSINEIFGFENANQLLIIIKQVLDKNIKKGEFFCRESYDLFYAYLCEQDTTIAFRLKSIMDEVAQKCLEICDYQLKMYAGILFLDLSRASEISTNEINLRLSLLLARAKTDTTETFFFYDEKLTAQEETQNYIEAHMQQALADGEFKLYLQPKMDLSSGTIGAAEALVRWQTNSGRMIYPDQFIPLFNKNGFCVKLDMHMLEQACILMRSWIDSGIEPIPISVNQSRLLFFEARYVENVSSIVEKYKIPPGLITLEVLEEMYLEKMDDMNTKIAELRRRGFLISMDDFGSGYSSFSAIGELNVDELKLDRKFLMEASGAANWRMKIVIDQIIRMARRLHLSTVAEGVETKEDEQLIKALGCDYGQGYYYCKPIPASEFNERYMHNQPEADDDDEPLF